eukprot:4243992-Lingulodinium_polyedra.AAC.1
MPVAPSGAGAAGPSGGPATVLTHSLITPDERRANIDPRVFHNVDKIKSNSGLLDYQAWKRLVRSGITGGRPEVGMLLSWAEKQPTPIGLAEESVAGASLGITLDVTQASTAIYSALMNVIDKGILDSRCRLVGEDRGLELWRSMVVEP